MNKPYNRYNVETLSRIESRLIRIESRVCQLMIRMGMNPSESIDTRQERHDDTENEYEKDNY